MPGFAAVAWVQFRTSIAQNSGSSEKRQTMETVAAPEVWLDSSQQRFCSDPGTAVRLLAPAGSGKTHSILHRCLAVARRASEEKPRFLVFTFTRAARDELATRLHDVPAFDEIRALVDVSTVNSWGFRWLRPRLTNARLVASTTDRYFCLMNVLQPAWQREEKLKALLTDSRRRSRGARQVMDLADQLKGLGFRHDRDGTEAQFHAHVDWLTDRGMEGSLRAIVETLRAIEVIDDTPGDAADPWPLVYARFFDFWREAIERMHASALLTLEDQKYWALLGIEEQLRDGRAPTGSQRFSHILVDEFQDINPLDLELLKAIAALHRTSLTIVGDDDQAIFEWRGATPEFILEPERDIGCAYTSHVLEVNYRSPRNIVEMSQRLIAHNRRRVLKHVRAASDSTAEVHVVRVPNLQSGIERVLELARSALTGPRPETLALIGRKRSQIIPYQIVFARHDIAFCAAEDLHVLLSDAFDELKNALALKAQASNPSPFGPDPVEALVKLADKVRRYPLSKVDRGGLRTHVLAARPPNVVSALEALYSYRGPLKGANADGERSAEFYAAIRALLQAESVADTIRALSLHFEGLQRDYGKSLDDIFFLDPPFLHLAEYATPYGSDFAAFYRDIEKAATTLARLPSDADADQPGQAPWNAPVHLMTALRAKGKEFDNVVVLDCNSDIWPSPFAITERELEAERRLFYVAITRPRRRLYLLVDGTILGRASSPSPYLAEMGLANDA